MKQDCNKGPNPDTVNIDEKDKRFIEYLENQNELYWIGGKQTILKQKIEENISKLLLEVPNVMEREDATIAERIFKSIHIYEKVDKWASAIDYDKKKYIDLLCEYKNFLLKYGVEKDAADVQIRIDAMREAMSKQDEKKSNS